MFDIRVVWYFVMTGEVQKSTHKSKGERLRQIDSNDENVSDNVLLPKPRGIFIYVFIDEIAHSVFGFLMSCPDILPFSFYS